MAAKDWYTINRHGKDYTCVAVDKDYNFVKQYNIFTSRNGSRLTWCECRKGLMNCRHKKMVRWFLIHGLIGSRTYYNFDSNTWMSIKGENNV